MIDEAIEIIQSTNDGNDLDPAHLRLVEAAVNGWLTDAGKEALQKLLVSVRAGYVKPWFHGVEHLTRDHQGYVLWRGTIVEHYSFRDAERERQEAIKLGAACAECEKRGLAVTFDNIYGIVHG